MIADLRSYMTYQPLLAEAAAGNLEPRHVVVPPRGVPNRTQAIARNHVQVALRVIATGPDRETSFPGQEEKEDDHHAYQR